MRVATYHLRGLPRPAREGRGGPKYRKCKTCGAFPGNPCWNLRGLYPKRMSTLHEER